MSHSKAWYENGLAFKCTACGACCTGAGHVRLSIADMEKIASYLRMSLEDFVQSHVDRIAGSWMLKENQLHGDCIFLKDQKCSIYPARPTQCQTFPWWPHALQSESNWQALARSCEGIEIENSDIYSWQDIQSILKIELADRKHR